MKSPIFLLSPFSLLLFPCSLLLVSCAVLRASEPRPNILYILADDLGYGDLSCYGQQRVATPHLDRLAAEGMRFTQHYSGTTVCAPSRAAFLEGRHTGHTSVRGNQPPHLLDPKITTLPEALKQAGSQAVRQGQWKAVRRNIKTGTETFELFDLEADLAESRNLAAAQPAVAARLRALMAEAHTPHPVLTFARSQPAAK